VITDRGRPVARIVPADLTDATVKERLLQLERQGLLTRPQGRGVLDLTPVNIGPEGAQRYLEEDRHARDW